MTPQRMHATQQNRLGKKRPVLFKQRAGERERPGSKSKQTKQLDWHTLPHWHVYGDLIRFEVPAGSRRRQAVLYQTKINQICLGRSKLRTWLVGTHPSPINRSQPSFPSLDHHHHGSNLARLNSHAILSLLQRHGIMEETDNGEQCFLSRFGQWIKELSIRSDLVVRNISDSHSLGFVLESQVPYVLHDVVFLVTECRLVPTCAREYVATTLLGRID